MELAHTARALRALTMREIVKFVQQRGRLLSALVRPLMWLAVFAAGFYNVFGVSIIPPYKTYITYQVYIVPGLLGIILLFHGMQSSLSMVYDREMGVMRLLLTAPLPRWVLLACKLAAGTALSVLTCYVFLAVCILFDVTFEWSAWLEVLPALIISGLMLGALWLFLSVYIKQVENFAGAMNFVMFPMFFFSSAPVSYTHLDVYKRQALLRVVDQSFHPCGRDDPFRALRHVRAGLDHGRGGRHDRVLPAGGARLRPAARHAAPRRARGVRLTTPAPARSCARPRRVWRRAPRRNGHHADARPAARRARASGSARAAAAGPRARSPRRRRGSPAAW